jgi:methylmalonyl-CoA mutase C-terminal domain/subunit
VGLSILSGAHLALTGKVLELLRDQGAEDIPVLVGGLIPEEDKDRLRELGVAGVFTAGTPISEVAQFITSRMAAA